MPRVSVIIPAHNRAHVVGEAIDSVLAQTYQDFEVIVVDDASTDNTHEVLSRYLAKYPDRIRVIYRETNGGAGAARNDGVRSSSGEFTAFLDSDDTYMPNRFESALSFLDTHPDYGAVYGDMVGTGSHGEFAGRYVTAGGGGCSGWIFERLLERDLIWTPTITLRRDVLERAGLFDEALYSGQDSELWWRVARATRVGYIDAVLSTWRRSPGSLSQSGSRSSGSRAHRACRALDTYANLTARERRLLNRRLYGDLRSHAFFLATEGSHRAAREACRSAVQVALQGRLWISVLKGLAALWLGPNYIRRMQALREGPER